MSVVVSYGAGIHRIKIDALQSIVDQAKQVDCPVRWIRAPGIMAREITIPQDTVLIGAVHKVQNIAILSKGKMILATDKGPVHIEAPHTLIVQPGQKNACTALDECVWTNVWASDEEDLDKFVEQVSESKACELIGGSQNKQLNMNKEAICLSD